MKPQVLVVGGGPAGCSAALTLARSGHKVTLIDAGGGRNAMAAESRGYIGFDGANNGAMRRRMLTDVLRYPEVSLVKEEATAIDVDKFSVRAETAGGAVFEGGAVVLACGVRDELPGVPGLREVWGTRAHHCIHCTGYELRGTRVGLLATTRQELHLSRAQVVQYAQLGIAILVVATGDAVGAVASDVGDGADSSVINIPAVQLQLEQEGIFLTGATGVSLKLDHLLVTPRPSLPNFVLALGLHQTSNGRIEVSYSGRTNVRRVFAAGDAARIKGWESEPAQQILAAASGFRAGAAAAALIVPLEAPIRDTRDAGKATSHRRSGL